jgi:hypothetical protein
VINSLGSNLMQGVIIELLCKSVIKYMKHMNKINKIFTVMTLITINMIFLFGGQTNLSSRLVPK